MLSIFDTISDELAEHGYIILEDALDIVLTQAIYKRITSFKHTDFHHTNIGRGAKLKDNAKIRSDKTLWLDGDEYSEKKYLSWMNTLRLELNQSLYMGMYDYEAHFSHYEIGSFYQKHYDVLQGNNKRILTTVFYLTKDWLQGDGGELIIYSEDQTKVIKTVRPKSGTMVIFLSDKFPHEVLTSKKDRYSIAGWFRGRSEF